MPTAMPMSIWSSTNRKARRGTLAASAGYSTGEGLTAESTWTPPQHLPARRRHHLSRRAGHAGIGAGRYLPPLQRQAPRPHAATERRGRPQHLCRLRRHHRRRFGLDFARLDANLAEALDVELRASKRWRRAKHRPIRSPACTSTRPITLPIRRCRSATTRSDDLLNPARGFRLSGQVTPQLIAGSGSASNVRTVLDGSYYYPIGGRIVLATRARAGCLARRQPGRHRAVAAALCRRRRFRARLCLPGPGARSTSTAIPRAGRSLVETSFELRYRFGNYGIVPFIDMGQVYDKTFPTFSDLRIGIGVGARLLHQFRSGTHRHRLTGRPPRHRAAIRALCRHRAGVLMPPLPKLPQPREVWGADAGRGDGRPEAGQLAEPWRSTSPRSSSASPSCSAWLWWA